MAICELPRPKETRVYPSEDRTQVTIRKTPLGVDQLYLPARVTLGRTLATPHAGLFLVTIYYGDWVYFDKKDSSKLELEGVYITYQTRTVRDLSTGMRTLYSKTAEYHINLQGLVNIDPSGGIDNSLLKRLGIKPYGINASVKFESNEKANAGAEGNPVLTFIEVTPYIQITDNDFRKNQSNGAKLVPIDATPSNVFPIRPRPIA